MSDPLERFRSTTGGGAPDVEAIRGRARMIRRRRYTGLSAGAAALAALAVAGVLVAGGPGDRAAQLAQRMDAPSSGGSRPAAEAEDAGDRAKGPASANAQAPADAAPPEEADLRADSPRTQPSGGGEQREADARAGAAESSPSDAGGRIVVTLRVAERAQGASFTMSACNTGDEPVELAFPTGQRYDFEVHRDGELVWRWSDGRAFTMVYGSERMEAGQCRTYTDSWDGTTSDGPASPGGYDAVGVLASDPPRRSAAQAFCLDACS